jgi:serine/threonine protein kinase
MTTRDPRSRVPQRPTDGSRDGVREVTASMSIDISDVPADRPGDGEPSHPSLAVGTGLPSDVDNPVESTRIASPAGRHRTPQPKESRPPPPPKSGDEANSQIGSQLGVYRLTELLGKGGMGYVYKAEHVKLGREVALKLLRGDYAKRRDAVLRFFQEAKTVNRVRHRNIVDVTDFVELDDGTTFIIMELLRGQSLGRWAKIGIDLPRALAVLVQICDGLGAAHAVGVVHRDLKPDNVIVIPTSDGAELVKLLDFGVAKLVNRDDEDVGFQTAAGSVIGTPAYMSPEQAGGMLVDHRSDIYSLGAIMYELFCGQPMFRGRSFGEYVRKHLTEYPIPPRQTQAGAGMDDRLEGLILKCLSKDPNGRFSHILELRDQLLHLLGGIETQPPGSVVVASYSPVRATLDGAGIPPQMFRPGMATTQPTGPAGHLSHSSVMHPSLSPSQYTLIPEQESQGATPWWIWFVGGAVAVAVGIAGALWYAGKGKEPVAAASQKPTTVPIEQPVGKMIELRFDSLPSGGVYADGRSAELCRTPCNFNVDLRDGGPTGRRTFVVRADGYEDKRVDVDFKVSQRDFSVSLTRLAGQAGATSAVSEEAVETVDLTVDTSDAPKAGKKTKKKKTGRSDRTDRNDRNDRNEKSTKVETAEKPPEEVKKPPEEVKKPPEEVKKPVGKIDRTDTIDPFRKK